MNFLRIARCSRLLFNFKPKPFTNIASKVTETFKIFKRKYMYDMDLRKEITQDTLLYRHDVTRFNQLLQAGTVVNYIVWVWLATFALQHIESPDPEKLKQQLAKNRNVEKSSYAYSIFEKMINFTSYYNFYIMMFCVVIGYGTGIATSFYVTRNIHSIVLKRGGDKVSIYTNAYVPTSTFLHEQVIPLSHISCRQSRQESPGYISVKIKDKRFYYLISKKGSFVSPELFDRTVGLQRNFEKNRMK